MKQVIYKEIVEIDGISHIILSCDYSNSINEAISDEVLQDNNDEIIDYITDDIVNPQ
jgi:aspartate/glutamate racemase